MAHDIFISYSSKDKNVVDKICTVLEASNIVCWIAPRDVSPGALYAKEIVNAIQDCPVMLLIFSDSSNGSEHVGNEIDIAFNAKKIIVPYKISDAEMAPEFRYYLNKKHWIISYPDPEQKLGELIELLSNFRTVKYDPLQELQRSIIRASRIQEAIFPRPANLEKLLPECLMILKPKNGLSGDFCWTKQTGSYTILAVADSIGHGIHGALISMLGIAFLERVIHQISKIDAGLILEGMHQCFSDILHPDHTAKIGMEIAILIIDNDQNEWEYSGARIPLYMVSNGELTEIKGGRLFIGTNTDEIKQFTVTRNPIRKDDVLYLVTDGFADQFGGEALTKYMSKNLKRLLLSISQKPMKEQQDILEQTFYNWKGELEQTDDILMVGIRL